MVLAMHAQSSVVFDFQTLSDTGGNYTGTLENGAALTTLGTHGVLSLGSDNGYFDLGESFGSLIKGLGETFTISVDVFVPAKTDISGNGNFIWCFSKSSAEGYLFLNAKQMRYAITQTSYGNETSVNAEAQLPKGEWVNIMYVQDGATGTVYLNNVERAQNPTMALFPSALTLPNNYLGRSCYNGDAYLKDARYTDFRVYDTALGSSEREALVAVVDELNLLEEGIVTEADKLEADMKAVYVPMVAYKKIDLPTVGKYGTTISWISEDPSRLTADGTVVRQEANREVGVELTATFTLGDLTQTRSYAVSVMPKEEYKHYLFAFFPNNSDENIYFAVGDDGYNYITINNDHPVFSADGNTVMGGLRDPHILRGEDGFFYMVATDMRSAMGWSSNRGIVLMRSDNLINWTCSQVHFPTRYAGTYLENVTRVWAPETIYDHGKGKFMVYFSILTNDGTVPYDKVYYAYANQDFTDLEGEPVYLYDRGSATIDMDIVYNDADALYHGFYKNEGSGGICKVTAESLTPDDGEPAGSQWSEPSGTLQQTNEAVEGAGVFRLINDDQWILMYDCYMNGHYQFCSSRDLANFTFVKNTATDGSFTPRHGTVLPITDREYWTLLETFPYFENQNDDDGHPNLTAERISQLCESSDNWTECSGFVTHYYKDGYSNNDALVKGTFMERWKDRASIGYCLASKTLRYLPVGTYRLSASCIATWQYDAAVTVSGVNFFAGDQKADVHTEDSTPELYTLTFGVQPDDDYTTALGVETTAETNANWVAFDNFRLYFVGTKEEYHTALRAMHEDYIARAEAVYARLHAAWQPELRAAIDAVNPDETCYGYIADQLDALQEAVATAQQHIDEMLLLYDDDSTQPTGSQNTSLIAAAGGKSVVALSGRTFQKDGNWNTLCLPFSVGNENAATGHCFDGTPLEGATVMTLDNGTGSTTGFDTATGTLTLDFTEVGKVESGVPYIVKWTKPDGYDGNPATFDISNPLFTDITISDEMPADHAVDSQDGYVRFIGNYGSTDIYTAEKNNLYIGTGNTLYYPWADGMTSFPLNAFRAYFALQKGLTAGDPVGGVRAYVLNFGVGTVDGIGDIRDRKSVAVWHDLSGRRLGGRPSQRGVYIVGGKKVVMR
jgi:hypothetical protein